MRVIISIGIISLVFFGAFFYFTRYSSAFEADQACHFELWKMSQVKPDHGCDHDLETRQWLLYEVGINNQPSNVLRRFRY